MVGSRLREAVDCEAMKLQRGFHEALCNAAREVQQSFVNALYPMDRCLSLVVGYAKTDELSRPRSFTTHSSYHESPLSRAGATLNSGGAHQTSTTQSSAPT